MVEAPAFSLVSHGDRYYLRYGDLGAPGVPLVWLESNTKHSTYKGVFRNGAHFKLLVTSKQVLTDKAKATGLQHVVSLYVGDKYEKLLRGNYYIFDSLAMGT